MASRIKIESGSVLIGNPIIISILSDTISGDAVFHKVKVQVSARLSTEESFENYILSASVENNQVVLFDISDALRSLVGKFSYLPNPSVFHYPKIEYKLSAWDEYMKDGVLYEISNKVELVGSKYGLFGAFTDLERMFSPGFLKLTSYSRKPTTGEVCGSDETLVYSYVKGLNLGIDSEIIDPPTLSKMPLSGKKGLISVAGRTVYVDENISQRMQFRFVNGLGVIESISADCLPEIKTSGSMDKSVSSVKSSFSAIPSIFGTKSSRNMKLKCSTGAITKEWAAWWHNEFFSGDEFRKVLHESCWVKMQEHWIPCVCYLDDEVTVYDESSDKIVQLEFTVDFGLSGVIIL